MDFFLIFRLVVYFQVIETVESRKSSNVDFLSKSSSDCIFALKLFLNIKFNLDKSVRFSYGHNFFIIKKTRTEVSD